MSLVLLNASVSNSDDTVSADKMNVPWRKQSGSPGFACKIKFVFVPSAWEDSNKPHYCRGTGNFTNTTQKQYAYRFSQSAKWKNPEDPATSKFGVHNGQGSLFQNFGTNVKI